jgi:DNA-binding transcriptional ArsR family regulator
MVARVRAANDTLRESNDALRRENEERRRIEQEREAALVRERRRGRERVYTLAPERLEQVSGWLDEYRVFWAARLHELKELIEALPDSTPPSPRPRRRKR